MDRPFPAFSLGLAAPSYQYPQSPESPRKSSPQSPPKPPLLPLSSLYRQPEPPSQSLFPSISAGGNSWLEPGGQLREFFSMTVKPQEKRESHEIRRETPYSKSVIKTDRDLQENYRKNEEMFVKQVDEMSRKYGYSIDKIGWLIPEEEALRRFFDRARLMGDGVNCFRLNNSEDEMFWKRPPEYILSVLPAEEISDHMTITKSMGAEFLTVFVLRGRFYLETYRTQPGSELVYQTPCPEMNEFELLVLISRMLRDGLQFEPLYSIA